MKQVIAFIKANLFAMRCPWKYRVITKTEVFIREGDVYVEEYVFIGVMQDIPDVTEYSIIHKLRPVKTYYGEWDG